MEQKPESGVGVYSSGLVAGLKEGRYCRVRIRPISVMPASSSTQILHDRGRTLAPPILMSDALSKQPPYRLITWSNTVGATVTDDGSLPKSLISFLMKWSKYYSGMVKSGDTMMKLGS